jgi:hypothetical protein
MADSQGFHRHILRQKYGHQRKLKELLDSRYGLGNYRVRIQEKHWLLLLPDQLSEHEMSDIEDRIRVHYREI